MLRRPGWFAFALVFLAVAALAWSILVEPARLVVVERTIVVDGWDVGYLDVALVSDLHVGAPHADVDKMREVAAAITAAQPDLVLLLGDYDRNGIAGGEKVDPAEWAPLFGSIPAPFGVYAVLGNHDWWNDTPRIRAALEDGGVEVLENAAVRLRSGRHAFWLVGVGDTMTEHDRVSKAFKEVPAQATVLTMSHGPDVVDELGDRSDLVVAGHTHGGQVYIPFVTASLLNLRWLRGLYYPGGVPLYVTSGVGTSVYPIRFGVPPEVVILHVRPTKRGAYSLQP